MKAAVNRKRANPTAKADKRRVYYSGRTPILAPISPALAEEIERETEWYRLRTFAQQTAFIERICQQIAEAFKPDKIILFGSRAYGKPRIHSDVDLLVIMPYEGSSRAQATRIRSCLDKLVEMDLLVRTADEVRERIALEDDFMQEIIEHGKVMYEANHA